VFSRLYPLRDIQTRDQSPRVEMSQIAAPLTYAVERGTRAASNRTVGRARLAAVCRIWDFCDRRRWSRNYLMKPINDHAAA
jgi:hypothetical protein